jgi:hypothetical protein
MLHLLRVSCAVCRWSAACSAVPSTTVCTVPSVTISVHRQWAVRANRVLWAAARVTMVPYAARALPVTTTIPQLAVCALRHARLAAVALHFAYRVQLGTSCKAQPMESAPRAVIFFPIALCALMSH